MGFDINSLMVGSTVWVDCCEGMGGPGVVIEWRDEPSSNWRVQMLEGSNGFPQKIWLFNVEIVDEIYVAGDRWDEI